LSIFSKKKPPPFFLEKILAARRAEGAAQTKEMAPSGAAL